MNWFDRWQLRRIVKKAVRQDFDHHKKIEAVYSEIAIAAHNEFREDNMPTLKAFLEGCFYRGFLDAYATEAANRMVER